MLLSEKTQARLGRMIDIFYYLLILAGFYLFMKYALWLVFPFLFAFFIAVLLQRPINYAQRRIKLKKSFTSVALVLLFYLLLILIVVLIGARLWSAAKSFADYLSAQVQNLPRIIKSLEIRINQLVEWLPDDLELRVNESLANFTQGLLAGVNAEGESVGVFGNLVSLINLEWFKAPVSGMLTIAGRIPMLALSVVITIISSFFMTSGYDKIVGFLKRQLGPERGRALSAAKRIVFSSLRKLVRSYSIIIGVSFCELVLGLLLLGFAGVYDGKQLLWIALVTAAIDILPVLGVGTVLIPWFLYSFIMGNYGLGVGLLVMWVVMIVVRQIIEPKVVADSLGLPPVVTLMGMYIGLQLFSVIGMFLVPLLLILIKMLNDEGVLKLWKTAEPETPKPQKKPKKSSDSQKKEEPS